ncbi:MAG: VWA domain-containing protein [Candidatus Marinimicrobia bacterium]|jgi:Ca-activated chloride channel family protein|nr:VWA domain-containing protein [Candidatus Neomarinimicrobiota bacterium]MBT3496212.1 VWA domain-containing protein [Candidatus Neomarinimicrobiota bacterium]MBT3693060.1 VWA domain-containing protein [Candidatus Neomarinimicrobiota bacterium]MBT3732774.1 VWA domain-containing protein [Candidatus Neomarinimicrobiota bacterium]MBT4143924.1 VWA domain-containing protein [Candidatus Neomarinimicrobiota bacterium]
MIIQFQNPIYLLLLSLIPIYVIWYRRIGRRKEGTIRISSSSYFVKSFKRRGQNRHRITLGLNLLVILFIILGIARPQLIDYMEESKMEVIDMVLVLDISSSMLADDFKPNRLEVAKQTATEFISGRKGDRIGLLVFAGQTFIQCPLTVDMSVLKGLLQEVQVATRDYDGTAIGMAIANATNRLRHSEAKSKVMILLSDGSNNAGELDPITASDLASEFGIKIYTIGIGTDKATTRIPGRGLIRNEIDEKTLRQIASKTNGKYFRAKYANALREIYQEIDQLERSEIEVKTFTRHEDLYAWFLFPAFLLGLGGQVLNRSIFRNKT